MRTIALALASLLALAGCRLERRPIDAGGQAPVGRASTLARAPEFALADVDGKEVSLGKLTSRGAALVVFYRGYW